MKKYKIMILNRIDQDNLIVKAKSLDKRKNPSGENSKESKPPKSKGSSLRELFLEFRDETRSQFNNQNTKFDRIESILQEHGEMLLNLDKRIVTLENKVAIIENRVITLESTNR